ncbi:MAG TPA: hypothetical protein VJB63_02040 [Patescibacteria group bacterium]|nr:hypothetical protein [Patescibacteria group bacterium]
MQEIIRHTLEELNKTESPKTQYDLVIKAYQKDFETLVSQHTLLEPLTQYIPQMIKILIEAFRKIRAHDVSEGTTISPEEIKRSFTKQWIKKIINAPSFPVKGNDVETEYWKKQLESTFFTLYNIEFMKDTPHDMELNNTHKFDSVFLKDIEKLVQPISMWIDKHKPEDFKEKYHINWILKELQGINLGDILGDDQKTVKWFGLNSIDDLKEVKFNRNDIAKKIIDYFWHRYSPVFILKQRIDKYELPSDTVSESQESLQKLSGDLEGVCRSVQNLFETMGITPMYIELFETEYDENKHDESNRASPMLANTSGRLILKKKVDMAHRRKENVDRAILDILSLGYESNLDDLQSKKSEVIPLSD